ncbi:hypothetical protein [Bradyrhizobium sp. SZCCHNRI1003]|uniref:hypothetical protein n=1 Tax=Bradyrhizobium sp. SZCCHNRI1003 TaxID=3057275 RepID=UPI0029160438|nr:hypothetical protein [Bradyrhizobium sp. SZCCHNRI1003]
MKQDHLAAFGYAALLLAGWPPMEVYQADFWVNSTQQRQGKPLIIVGTSFAKSTAVEVNVEMLMIAWATQMLLSAAPG